MMVSSVAPHFWTAVEDCLVTFHHLQRCTAAEKVTSLWRKLPTSLDGSGTRFSDMIYHAEPWQIACNLWRETTFRSLPIKRPIKRF
jgi:hypothetical protein